ncbi:MAG: cytochrome c oxidase subunit 3 [Myxococcales bacterium]|nr:cytochrome c oxidase subunit 3 [Myxococcales bacterium]
MPAAEALSPAPDGQGSLSHGPRRWPDDPYVGRASALKVGMWVFLLSDGFSFAGLLLTYGILRAASVTWQPAGEPDFGLTFTAGLTFLLICSSLTMVMALAACREGKRGKTLLHLGLTMLGGGLFLCGQYHEYFGIGGPGLLAHGLRFSQSHRATTFYVITGFHGLHVATGLLLLGMSFVRTARTRNALTNADALETTGLFWHFVDLVWILVFTFVYLIPAPIEAAP